MVTRPVADDPFEANVTVLVWVKFGVPRIWWTGADIG